VEDGIPTPRKTAFLLPQYPRTSSDNIPLRSHIFLFDLQVLQVNSIQNPHSERYLIHLYTQNSLELFTERLPGLLRWCTQLDVYLCTTCRAKAVACHFRSKVIFSHILGAGDNDMRLARVDKRIGILWLVGIRNCTKVKKRGRTRTQILQLSSEISVTGRFKGVLLTARVTLPQWQLPV
jgi:hypothetical protein